MDVEQKILFKPLSHIEVRGSCKKWNGKDGDERAICTCQKFEGGKHGMQTPFTI